MSGSTNKKGLPTLGIMALLGLFLIFWPGATMNIVGRLVGIALLLVAAAVAWDWYKGKSNDTKAIARLVGAVVALVLGIWVLANPARFVTLIPKLIGLVIMIYGAVELYRAYSTTKNPVTMALCGIGVVLGLLVFINPIKTTSVAIRCIGIALVYSAVSGAVNEFKLLK